MALVIVATVSRHSHSAKLTVTLASFPTKEGLGTRLLSPKCGRHAGVDNYDA